MDQNLGEILLVGSDRRVSEPLRETLLSSDYAVRTAERYEEGFAKAMEPTVSVVVGQLRDPHFSALELLRELHPVRPTLPIILVDREVTMESAVEATRLGAYRYVAPPFSIRELFDVVVEAASTEGDFIRVNDADAQKGIAGLVGCSGVMKELFMKIAMGANSAATILIRGATGTGKELIAKALHQYSARAGQPFMAVNCNAMSPSLIESELFGHEQGAFTGARGRRLGIFESAHKGTLFLDEIGDLAPAMQVKLLRVLQEREIYRVGGRQPIQVDIKVIAATHQNLEKLIQTGAFREDLFQRLSGFQIFSPDLRDRREDIWPLTQHFLIKHRQQHPIASVSVERQAIAFLEGQPWPGNVRELENAVYNAALCASGRPIRLEHVQRVCINRSHISSTPLKPLREPPTDLFEQARSGRIKNVHALVMEQTERSLFKKAFDTAAGNQSNIARWLGLTRKTVRSKLRQFKLGSSHTGGPDVNPE